MSDLLMDIKSLQNLLISRATGDINSTNEKISNSEYYQLRQLLLSNEHLKPYIPEFIVTCRDLSQFWQDIKHKFETYQERKNYIYKEFNALLDYAEFPNKNIKPYDNLVNDVIEKIDAIHVQSAWNKSLERRIDDPEGAITSARTLIESVCKHILDEESITYDDKQDLPKLYKQTAELLNLAPSQHTEDVFKQILGGCTAVIEGLGSLRNRLSDAHGKGKIGVRPAPRHAELTVNLAGSLASYLLATWENKKEEQKF